MKELSGRVALLTGASGGIGRAIAERLAREGVDLVLTGRRPDALSATAEAVAALGRRAEIVPADLRDPAAVASLPAAAEAALGPIDVLVNNAGIDFADRFESTPPEELQATVEVNLVVPMLLTQALVPGMVERGQGHVVFVASAAGRYGVAFVSAYAASKAGLFGLTQALRSEYRHSPVGFSVVAPGFVRDDGMYQRIEEAGHGAPRRLGRTTTGRVADSVVRAIKKDLPELLPTGAPAGPVFALSPLAPRLMERVAAGMGMHKAFEGEAKARDADRRDV